MNHKYAEKKPVYNSKKSKKENKLTYVCNKTKRDDFIKKFGELEFEKISEEDSEWGALRDIPIPEQYSWLFSQFLEIWGSCERDFNGNVILGPRDILEYELFIGVQFTYRERKLLILMKLAAQSAIFEINQKNDS